MTNMQFVSDRNTMMCHRNVFQHLLDKFQNMSTVSQPDDNFLEMHGVAREEIDDIHHINELVQKGKHKLQSLLKEYDDCVKNIDVLNSKIKDIEDKFYQFELYHKCLINIDERFADVVSSTEDVSTLKATILEDFDSELASSSIEKDRLEALILSLGKTYGILRTSPLVHVCPICMTNDVDTFLEPCGHTICHDCISNKFCNSTKFCYMCRTAVRGIRRLYFSS